MIPLVSGFSGLKVGNIAPDNTIYNGFVLNYKWWPHPMGNAIFVRPVGHWAHNGLRNRTTIGGFVLYMNNHFRRPVHPDAILASLDDGFVKFETGSIAREDVDEYHCRAIATMSEWDVLARRLPYGEITSREFIDVFPEAIVPSWGGPPAGDIDTWPMDPVIAPIMQDLVEASIDDRVELLKGILYTGTPPNLTPYAKPATSFVVLDENHWYPIFITTTLDLGGGTFTVATSFVLPGETNVVVGGNPGASGYWPFR